MTQSVTINNNRRLKQQVERGVDRTEDMGVAPAHKNLVVAVQSLGRLCTLHNCIPASSGPFLASLLLLQLLHDHRPKASYMQQSTCHNCLSSVWVHDYSLSPGTLPGP
jgi:hypothetical protein